MNRSLNLLLRLVLLAFGLTSALASAQTPLDAYTRARTALEASIEAAPTDAVASLDSLREAREAFVPLGEALGSTLSQGLASTFDRAEQAIINASPTDLRVQGAVLYGGFERSLYEAALTQAQDGNGAQARQLLGVLGRDLELTPPQFAPPQTTQNSARALQLTFEKRLAVRSQQQLENLRALPESDRDARYEVLAQLYSHVFLIQDSPRLPANAQTNLVDAIQALIAGESIEANLGTLQTQLETFQSAITATQRTLQAPAQPAENAAATTPGANDETQAAAPNSELASQPVPRAAAPTAEAAAEGTSAESTGDAAALDTSAPVTSAPATTETVTPAPATTLPTTEESSGSAPLLTDTVRGYLLIAAGLLALVGSVLLLATIAASPAQNLATLLLLLPVLAEGLIALGNELAPLVGLPVLAQGARYSLFGNPLVQDVWLLLALVAGLLVLLGRRTAHSQPVPEAVPSTTTLEAAPTTRTPAGASSSATLSSPGGFNWDEDF